MVLLKQFDSELLLCLNESFIVFNMVTSDERIIQIAANTEVPKKHQIQDNENRSISSVCYSKTGEYFAILASKQVTVYRRDLSVVKSFYLQRTASKIRFTEKGDILVADKTGDAYLYKFEDVQNEPCLLLGHLSMLLDILLTDDNKFIITCDRDEKIRVSCYPNAYNIMSYCLGHKEFVTNIEVIGQYLISASGDGTLGFWDFLTGIQICSINTNDFIKDKDIIDNFCKEMDEEKCDVSSLPVVDMQIFKTELYIYIAVLLHNYKNIQIYVAQICDKNVKCTFHSNITLNSVPLTYSFNKNLYVLTKENLNLYTLENDKFELKENSHLVKLYNKHKEHLVHFENVECISILYKRKFDNVQEYLKRKKQRLEGKINS